MAGFNEGVRRDQTTLFPERLDDWIGEDHLVRVVYLFVDQLDLPALGFQRHAAAHTGRPGYHPAVLLKLFIYGYLNRIPSSRRLECEAGRNVEMMWLTGCLVADAPDGQISLTDPDALPMPGQWRHVHYTAGMSAITFKVLSTLRRI